MIISGALIEKACAMVEETSGKAIPFRLRGIKVDRYLIISALEILADAPQKTLPQNCRNDIYERTPDGLDRRIKAKLKTDLRTANIISDVLADAGIVKVVKVLKPETGRMVKATKLLDEMHWMKPQAASTKQTYNAKIRKSEINNQSQVTVKHGFRTVCREEYLENCHVKGFIKWLSQKLDQPGSFEHGYYLKKASKDWHCSSLYDAYEKYWWPFKMECPLQGLTVNGNRGLKSSFRYLLSLAKEFRPAVSSGDNEVARKCALAVLKWGGVLNKNEKRIVAMGSDICSYFSFVRDNLNMSTVRLGEHRGIHINSGFTKIYHLLIDDFIMYDGRVGAALGLLGRKYCEETGIKSIPTEIEFSFGRGQEATAGMTGPNRRDPSYGIYVLPEFTGDIERHLNDNIKASWLLKELLDTTESKFSFLPEAPPLNERLTALQSGLFMVGYDVRNNK